MQFFSDLSEMTFLQNALAAGLLASIAAGVVGAYVVVRRITYIAGSVAHCVLGGLGVARYLQVRYGWEWCDPIYGAVAAALLAAMLIGWVSLRAKQREDTVIGAVWSIGMAVGVVFMNMTPGYAGDLSNYLFGNILWVTRRDLWVIAGLDLLILVCVWLLHNRFTAICFDESFARLRGVPTESYYMLMLALTALTVVVLVKVVGIIMAIALLTLPVALAGNLTRSLTTIMGLGVLLSAGLTTGGLVISYEWNFPAGATIILLAGFGYCLSLLIGRRPGRAKGGEPEAVATR